MGPWLDIWRLRLGKLFEKLLDPLMLRGQLLQLLGLTLHIVLETVVILLDHLVLGLLLVAKVHRTLKRFGVAARQVCFRRAPLTMQ